MAIREVSVDELAAHIEAAQVEPAQVAATQVVPASGSLRATRLIDVREVDEYEHGHVPGAELVVLGTVADNVDQFRGDGPTYVICKSGARSMRACEFLEQQGIEAINVAGGTMAWVMSGRPVVVGDSATGDAPS